MKTLKLDGDQINLIKRAVEHYNEDIEKEYLRLVNTAITEEERKLHTNEKATIDSLNAKLGKK